MKLDQKTISNQLHIRVAGGIDNQIYAEVLQLRRAFGDSPVANSVDGHSRHYVVRIEGKPIGCLTATRLRDGTIDCQHAYPMLIRTKFRASLMSLCRLRICRSPVPAFRVLRHLFRAAWQDQLQRQVRLDVINVHRRRIRGYQRIGYVPLFGTDFVHPVFGTDSIVMVLPADPNRKSFYRDLFCPLSDPLTLDKVLDTLKRRPLS